MSHFNNPIPRSGLPQFAESTKMRSPRDSDATGRLWQKAAKVTAQESYNLSAIQRLQRELSRLRRRIVGAGFTDTTSNVTENISTQAVIVALYEEDYLGVRKWNGTAYTSEIMDMAKSSASQMPNSANIDNVDFSYIYDDDNHRTSNNSGNTEAQVMCPRFKENQTIHMHRVDHSNVFNGSTEILWMEEGTEREWVKQYEP